MSSGSDIHQKDSSFKELNRHRSMVNGHLLNRRGGGMRLRNWVVLLSLVVASCSSAPPTGADAAKALIEESATAMGGWANIDLIKSQEIITGGQDWEAMQASDPKADPLQMDVFGQWIVVDLEKKRMRFAHDG